MADIITIKVSALPEATSTPFSDGIIPVATPGITTEQLALSQFRDDLFTDPVLTGDSTASTPNPGDDSLRIATTEYVQSELAALGLDPATSTDYGTVRTNTTDAVPIVYLKAEVDTLLAAIKPVNQGGTGGTSASGARSNLSAAQSGSNSDITALTALASVPSVVTTAISTAQTAATNNAVAIAAPTGGISMWAGASGSPPSGWLYCDGSAISRTTYAALFTAIGTTFGSGNGSTTFNLPNFLGRSPLGAGVSAQSGTNRTLGTTGGADTHTLSTTEMPAHTHGAPTIGRSSAATGNNTNGLEYGDASQGNGGPMTSTSTGSGGAHNNLHPFLAVNFIIKT